MIEKDKTEEVKTNLKKNVKLAAMPISKIPISNVKEDKAYRNASEQDSKVSSEQPLQDNLPRDNIIIEELFELNAHLGGNKSYLHPNFKKGGYVFAVENNNIIINLDKTSAALQKALNFVHDFVKNGGKLLIVGSEKFKDIVIAKAQESGCYYINHKWAPGLLTNFVTLTGVFKNRDILLSNNVKCYTHKEVKIMQRKIALIDSKYSGLMNMKVLPQALFLLDVGTNPIAAKEAKLLGIPVIGLVDSQGDPKLADYAIPINVNLWNVIDYIVSAFTKIIVTGAVAVTKAKLEKGSWANKKQSNDGMNNTAINVSEQ